MLNPRSPLVRGSIFLRLSPGVRFAHPWLLSGRPSGAKVVYPMGDASKEQSKLPHSKGWLSRAVRTCIELSRRHAGAMGNYSSSGARAAF